MNVKLPRLLDADLNEVRRLHPKAQSAEINLTPLTTASLSLRDGEGVRVRDFIELYTSRGTAGIFRVKSPNNGYGTYTDTISLEHGVCVLGDAIIPAEGTIKGTARQVFTFLMGYQSAKVGGVPMWTLGDVDVPDEKEVTYDYRFSNTLHALLDVLEQLDGYMMRFDQSAFPWVLHIKAVETAPSCEGRLGRNVVTAHVTIDDSELCTRLYCPRLPGGYMQLEENPEWGVVEGSLDFADEIPLETVQAECRKYLEARKAPAISVEIDGLELAATTGEELDSFDVGRMMRLALPTYGVTVEERITTISYASMLDQPETVRIYLANQLPDASTSVSRLQAESASMANWRTKTEKVVTNLKASDEGIKEINDKMVAWFSSVEIDLDATEEAAKFGALASYKEVYDLTEEIDYRITEAELILLGDGTSANAGLVARVQENEELISAAALTLYGDSTTAQAGLVARVGDNEAALLLTATDIGTLFEVKADETWVKKLVADEIDVAKGDIEYAISENILTDYLIAYENIQSYGWIEAPTIKATSGLEFKGESVSKTTLSVVTGISGGMARTADVDLLNTDVGEETTVMLGSADAVYSNGVHARFLQGDEYTTPVYLSGKKAQMQGTPFPTKLISPMGEKGKLRGNLKRVTPIGTAVSSYYPLLYAYEGDGRYTAVITDNMYYKGTAKDYYDGEGADAYAIEFEIDPGMLFYPGEDIWLRGDIVETALFYPGREVSGGLYTNFEQASVTMRSIKALTA